MSQRLQILVPEELAIRLRKVAERSRLSQSEWIRRLIERALAEERSVADPLAALSALEAPTADIERMIEEIETGRS
jgi:metal-responsive CopG/Arc/MetJ family transcriptional regulator